MKGAFLLVSALIHAALLLIPIAPCKEPYRIPIRDNPITVTFVEEETPRQTANLQAKNKRTRAQKRRRTRIQAKRTQKAKRPKVQVRRAAVSQTNTIKPPAKKMSLRTPVSKVSGTSTTKSHPLPTHGIPLPLHPPLVKHRTIPKYPYIARLRRYQGRVLLKALVGTDGKVRKVKVIASSGHKILDRSACEALKRWEFFPATIGGRPVEWWVEVPVVFKLDHN